MLFSDADSFTDAVLTTSVVVEESLHARSSQRRPCPSTPTSWCSTAGSIVTLVL